MKSTTFMVGRNRMDIMLKTFFLNLSHILKSKWPKFMAVLVMVLVFNCVSAQQDSTHLSQKEWYNKTLRDREIQHLKDSIALDMLHSQLQRGNSSSEQKILQAKLDSLQAKDSLSMILAKDSIDNLRANTNPVPVIFIDDTLYSIYTQLGPYAATKRVKDLELKLKHLYELPVYTPDSLMTDYHSDISLIKYKGEVIAAVTYLDAIWANKDLNLLLDEYAKRINSVVVANRENNSWNRTLERWGIALAVVLGILVAIYCVNRGFMYIVKKLIRSKSNAIRGIKINNYRIFSRAHVLSFLIQVLKVLRWIAIAIVIYAGFTFILSRFPYTHEWADSIVNWFKSPIVKGIMAFVHYLPNLLTIAFIVFVYYFLNKALFALGKEIESGKLRIKGFYPEWGLVTYKIVRFVLLVLVIVLVFPYLPGAHSDVFKGVSVFIGVLISIGSSSAISNTIAGLVITYMRPFKIGDWIKVGDSTGCVLEKNLLVTRMRTLQNEDITLPNTTILTGKTINYSESSRDPRCKGLVITVDLTIGYEVDWRVVTKLLMESAEKTDRVLAFPKPFVLQREFKNYNVSYQLNAYINEPEDMFFIHSDLLHKVMDIFHENNIEIRSPDYININETIKNE
ncbi:MAG: hypothetical protein DI598_01455 [Pseudopedobacter saltans]|uniref:MscS Mechanosensitive ion channel n=1 Tax=Pseudopedobacter saltans TaxID=151895 RepID=A0A2W5FCW7_9SPHI|nr:MAG: hypothetical protein DI598_01455 [Pseudopedobacter saltans]